jgi:hypothetical protein
MSKIQIISSWCIGILYSFYNDFFCNYQVQLRAILYCSKYNMLCNIEKWGEHVVHVEVTTSVWCRSVTKYWFSR